MTFIISVFTLVIFVTAEWYMWCYICRFSCWCTGLFNDKAVNIEQSCNGYQVQNSQSTESLRVILRNIIGYMRNNSFPNGGFILAVRDFQLARTVFLNKKKKRIWVFMYTSWKSIHAYLPMNVICISGSFIITSPCLG